MGIKMKRTIIVFLLFLMCAIQVFAQNKKSLEDMKQFALCNCINDNYARVDTAFQSHDVTNSYLMQSGILTIETYELFTEFIKEKTSAYYKIPPYGSYDSPKANQIFYFCMEFYKSKELDEYSKYIIRLGRKER